MDDKQLIKGVKDVNRVFDTEQWLEVYKLLFLLLLFLLFYCSYFMDIINIITIRDSNRFSTKITVLWTIESDFNFMPFCQKLGFNFRSLPKICMFHYDSML